MSPYAGMDATLPRWAIACEHSATTTVCLNFAGCSRLGSHLDAVLGAKRRKRRSHDSVHRLARPGELDDDIGLHAADEVNVQ